MNKKILLILIILITFLSGCWDSRESERMLYLYGIGVDYKDDKYEIYAQIIDFTNIAKSEQPNNPDAIQAEVGNASAETESEALFQLYKSLDEQLYWGHISYLVLSEDLLNSGKADAFINMFSRFHDTRYQTWIYSTAEPLGDVLLTTPIINKAISLSKMSDPLNSYKQDSSIEPINLRKLILRMDEPGHEVNIPNLTLTDKWKTKKASEKTTSFNGISVISPDVFKGHIASDKARGMQWMTNETKRSGMSIMMDADEYLSVALDRIHVKTTPIVQDGHVTFDINVKLNATVNGFKGKVTEQKIRKEVEKRVKKEIKDTYKEGLNIDADVFRLSEKLYRKDVKTWKKLQKDGKIELDENSIRNIKVVIEKVNSGRKSFKETIEDN